MKSSGFQGRKGFLLLMMMMVFDVDARGCGWWGKGEGAGGMLNARQCEKRTVDGGMGGMGRYVRQNKG